MFAMAGKKNRHVIVESMPGVMLGPIDFGGVSSPSSVFVSVDGGKTFDRKLEDVGENGPFYGRKDNGLQPSPVDKDKIIIVAYGRENKRWRSCCCCPAAMVASLDSLIVFLEQAKSDS